MMNSKVIVIPAKKKKGNSIRESEKKKLRVAAYARVSTDSDEQATSYDTQIDHYTNFIKKNHCGITIKSTDEIRNIIDNMLDLLYIDMVLFG